MSDFFFAHSQLAMVEGMYLRIDHAVGLQRHRPSQVSHPIADSKVSSVNQRWPVFALYL